MAVAPELPHELQQHEIRQRISFKHSNGWRPVQYLSPNFLTRFPLTMSSAETPEGLSWNDVTGLFRRRDTIPVTFIDEDRLIEEVKLNVFDKKPPAEFAERRALALFKLATEEGLFYGLTVVYLPSRQQRLTMVSALEAVFKTEGNAVALVGMPKEYSDCAYMPEPFNGGALHTSARVRRHNRHSRPGGGLCGCSVDQRVRPPPDRHPHGGEVAGAASLTRAGDPGLVDEVVFQRGPIWENKSLIERNQDDSPVIRNGRTIAIEREVMVAGLYVYSDTEVHKPLTLVACPPKHSPDDDEFTESVSEMEARIVEQMEEERKAQWEERVGRRKPQQGETAVRGAATGESDPSAIQGTDPACIAPGRSDHAAFSTGGAACRGSYRCSRGSGCRCGPGASGRSATKHDGRSRGPNQ